MAWNLKSSSDLTEEPAERWLSYAAFWQDVYGQETAMRDAQTRLAEEVHDRIRDGVIVTRAQIGSVEIRSSSRNSMCITTTAVLLEYVRTNCNQRIKDFLHEETGIFKCIALSVSAHQVEIKQDSSEEKGSGEKEIENTSESNRSVSGGNKNRVRVIKSRWKLEHRVNVLVIRKEDGYCYRIGLGEIKIDDWLEMPKRL
ncbi:hypothetical protein F5B21DRAFT_519048 [Xylaria acuta]|nr:hypothetical protein F5B21DRAFT_519048 [Xylaria acuta]